MERGTTAAEKSAVVVALAGVVMIIAGQTMDVLVKHAWNIIGITSKILQRARPQTLISIFKVIIEDDYEMIYYRTEGNPLRRRVSTRGRGGGIGQQCRPQCSRRRREERTSRGCERRL